MIICISPYVDMSLLDKIIAEQDAYYGRSAQEPKLIEGLLVDVGQVVDQVEQGVLTVGDGNAVLVDPGQVGSEQGDHVVPRQGFDAGQLDQTKTALIAFNKVVDGVEYAVVELTESDVLGV